MQPNPPLSTIDGKYDLLRRLGEGGMGAVYEARNRGTGRRVAVKVIAGEALAKNQEVVARFQREALASGAIESQYIAHVLDTGVDPASGSPYMVMELLSGEDLEHAIKRLGPLPPELALRVVAQACLGLQKAHEVGVVHRDIKPANIFLATRDGGEIVAKILDFGIAKVKMEELSGESARPHPDRRDARDAALHVARAGAREEDHRPPHRLSGRSAPSSTRRSTGRRRTRTARASGSSS